MIQANPLSGSEFVVFTTREYAMGTESSISAASHQLKTLHTKGAIIPITRGVWANPNHPYFTPLACVPLLLGTEQGYASFLTALHRHGIISQIPKTIQVATTGHSRSLKTPVGYFEFFQLKPEMMVRGVEWSRSHLPYRMANPEKALLDTLYLATRKGNRFASLPEFHAPIRVKQLCALVDAQVASSRIRAAILKQIESLRI